MSLERKIKRNEYRKQYGNKGVKAEWRLYQIHKYSLGGYAKMQNKTIDELMGEKV